MDPKEFYNRKAQQLSTLCDLLSEVQELTLQMMAAERKAKLDSLEWWMWDPLDQAWSAKFDASSGRCG
jgi:hypothetical protein